MTDAIPAVGSTWITTNGVLLIRVVSVKTPSDYRRRHGEPVRVRIEALPAKPGIDSTITLEEFIRDFREAPV